MEHESLCWNFLMQQYDAKEVKPFDFTESNNLKKGIV